MCYNPLFYRFCSRVLLTKIWIANRSLHCTMPPSNAGSTPSKGNLDLKHWTEDLGQPLMIFIFVLIAAHLLAFVRSPLLSSFLRSLHLELMLTTLCYDLNRLSGSSRSSLRNQRVVKSEEELNATKRPRTASLVHFTPWWRIPRTFFCCYSTEWRRSELEQG